MIPFLGILSWIIFMPLEITGFVLAIISIAKGRIAGGICLMLFSIFVVPITMVVAPIISSLIGVAAASNSLPPSNPPGFIKTTAPLSLPNLPGFSKSTAPTAAPTTEAEMAAERAEIQRQLDSKAHRNR